MHVGNWAFLISLSTTLSTELIVAGTVAILSLGFNVFFGFAGYFLKREITRNDTILSQLSTNINTISSEMANINKRLATLNERLNNVKEDVQDLK